MPPGRMTISGLLKTSVLTGSSVLAGAHGLDREVARFNVMEVPDIERWTRPDEFLLTAGYALRETPERLTEVIEALHARGVAGIGIKLGRYIDVMPRASLDMAERLGFPIVSLPADASFDDILTEGSIDLVNKHVHTMNQADIMQRRLVDIVLAGGDLQAVTDAIASELNVGSLVTTPDGRQITIGGTPDQVLAVRASAALDDTGRLRTESLDGALGVHPVPNPGAHPETPDAGTAIDETPDAENADVDSAAIVRVRAGDTDHGRLAVFAFGRTLGPDELFALDRAASVCALVTTRDLAVSAVEDKYKTDFVRDLTIGRAGNADQAIAHARDFGWDFDRPLMVVLIEPDPGSDDTSSVRRPLVERQAGAFAGALAHRDEGAAVVALSAETVIIMGAEARDRSEAKVADLVRHVRGRGGGGRKPFSVGMSRQCSGPDGVAAAYTQATTAVRVGRQVDGGESVTHFDSLGVYRLLSLVENEAELESFARETLRELADDTAEARDLRRTLDLLLATNINVAETARSLHFHYNTLRYRINKLERVLGPFTSRAGLRLDLSLALKILAMRGIGN